MTNCNHTFAYWSVVPPTHCYLCGACLACGSPRPVPTMPSPRPWPSWPHRPLGPYYSTTVHTSNVTSTGTLMNTVTT